MAAKDERPDREQAERRQRETDRRKDLAAGVAAQVVRRARHPKGFDHAAGFFLWESKDGVRCRVNLLNHERIVAASYFLVVRGAEIVSSDPTLPF